MAERRRRIPENLPPLRLNVRRGDAGGESTLAGDAFDGLAKALAHSSGPQVTTAYS